MGKALEPPRVFGIGISIGISIGIGIGVGSGFEIVTCKRLNRVMGTDPWPLVCLALAPLPTYQLITR